MDNLLRVGEERRFWSRLPYFWHRLLPRSVHRSAVMASIKIPKAIAIRGSPPREERFGVTHFSVLKFNQQPGLAYIGQLGDLVAGESKDMLASVEKFIAFFKTIW